MSSMFLVKAAGSSSRIYKAAFLSSPCAPWCVWVYGVSLDTLGTRMWRPLFVLPELRADEEEEELKLGWDKVLY